MHKLPHATVMNNVQNMQFDIRVLDNGLQDAQNSISEFTYYTTSVVTNGSKLCGNV